MAGKPKDLTNQRFGRLVVKEIQGRNKQGSALWLCQCDCSNQTLVSTNSLTRGNTTSCGCLRLERVRKHSGLQHKHRSEFLAWRNMIDRCTRPHHHAYKNYGARGITVCDRWLNSFEDFLEDMGVKPDKKLTLDRIDNDKGYSPENCRWATYRKQANNRRGNVIIEYQGQKLTVMQWARKFGLSRDIIHDRIERGWPIEKLFDPEDHRPNLNITYKNQKKSLRQWCIDLGLSYDMVHKRIKTYNWPIAKAFETPATQ